jgi:methyltransferase (TIGR00027 family)
LAERYSNKQNQLRGFQNHGLTISRVFGSANETPTGCASYNSPLIKESVVNDQHPPAPDNTAVRVALWRALHLEVDAPPHVFEDEAGLMLAAPGEGWRSRPDMSPFTRPFRASILARARFIEDLVAERAAQGIEQYVILGAGLDTFAQRRSDLASRLLVFEVDRPGPQAWKRGRLDELGWGVPSFLRFVSVDFEAGDAWWERLAASGFNHRKPAIVAATGVSMYLTKEAVTATLRQIASFAPGSTLAMSFMFPIEMAEPDLRPAIERAAAGARANGTPFLSFFTPAEILALALDVGFKGAQHIAAEELTQRYFANRTDGLRPPLNAEELLVATT